MGRTPAAVGSTVWFASGVKLSSRRRITRRLRSPGRGGQKIAQGETRRSEAQAAALRLPGATCVSSLRDIVLARYARTIGELCLFSAGPRSDAQAQGFSLL